MSSSPEWSVPPMLQPRAAEYAFDLERALAAVVGLKAEIPEDAFTAEVLGTERAGSGVFIRPGLVLTIGYLITEAERIWLALADGRIVPGHALGYDQESGFGLVQALARVEAPTLPLGRARDLALGERLVVGATGGRQRSLAARLIGRQEFAGYWEFVLDEALFTAPAHPQWGGTALIGPAGDLVGIGSLRLDRSRPTGPEPINMMVPIDLLAPILDDMLAHGRPNRPARPWLGLYATEMDGQLTVMGLARRGPAERAGLELGDVVAEVAGAAPADLADLFRKVWALGAAGVEVPLKLWRDGRPVEVRVRSADRSRFLKAPKVH